MISSITLNAFLVFLTSQQLLNVWEHFPNIAAPTDDYFAMMTEVEAVLCNNRSLIDNQAEQISALTKANEEMQADCDLLLALQGAVVDNWEDYDFAMETLNGEQ